MPEGSATCRLSRAVSSEKRTALAPPAPPPGLSSPLPGETGLSGLVAPPPGVPGVAGEAAGLALLALPPPPVASAEMRGAPEATFPGRRSIVVGPCASAPSSFCPALMAARAACWHSAVLHGLDTGICEARSRRGQG
jgi:hypothetical protein